MKINKRALLLIDQLLMLLSEEEDQTCKTTVSLKIELLQIFLKEGTIKQITTQNSLKRTIILKNLKKVS